MAVKIYDSSAGAFKDAPTPQIYDASAQAYKESTGLVYDASKGAWEERWGDIVSPQNGILYNVGKNVGKFINVCSYGTSSMIDSSEGIKLTYTGNGSGMLVTSKLVRLDNINRITFTGRWTNCNYFLVGIYETLNITNVQYFQRTALKTNGYNQSYVLDVSDIKGNYHIGMHCENSPSRTSMFTMNKCELV